MCFYDNFLGCSELQYTLLEIQFCSVNYALVARICKNFTENWLTFFRPHIFSECFWLSVFDLLIALLFIAVKFLRRYIAAWFLRLKTILGLECCCWKKVYVTFRKGFMTLFNFIWRLKIDILSWECFAFIKNDRSHRLCICTFYSYSTPAHEKIHSRGEWGFSKSLESTWQMKDFWELII